MTTKKATGGLKKPSQEDVDAANRVVEAYIEAGLLTANLTVDDRQKHVEAYLHRVANPTPIERLQEKLTEPIFRAKDVHDLIGLDYREAHKLDTLGGFSPYKGRGGAGWRQYSAFDLIRLSILNEIRKFKRTWEEFREVIKWLNEALRVNLTSPIHKAWCGYQNYVVTDFSKVFKFASDWRIEDFKAFNEGKALLVIPMNLHIEYILESVEIPSFKFQKDKKGFYRFFIDGEELELPPWGERRP